MRYLFDTKSGLLIKLAEWNNMEKSNQAGVITYQYNVKVEVDINSEVTAEQIRQEIQSNLESIECEAEVKFVAAYQD